MEITTPEELKAAEERLAHLDFRVRELKRGVTCLETSSLKPSLIAVLIAPLLKEANELLALITELQQVAARMK